MLFSSPSRAAALGLSVLLAAIPQCSAQVTTARIFQWAFESNSVSSTLGTCQEFGIVVSTWPNYDGNSSGVPPFYMRAWEQGGSVRTSLIGTDPTKLSWTLNNPTGSKLMLNVIDSNSSSGGVAPKLFSVDTGSTTNCVVDDSGSDFTVTSNVSSSSTLATCQQWGLRMHGGVPPYNISLGQIDSPVITNITTNQDDDAYTYINRADGGKLLMASVVDSSGRIAYGNPSIMTASETDIDCGSLISTSGNSTELDAAAAAEQASHKKSHTGLIVGVVIAVVAAILIAGVAFWWWYRRRNNNKNAGDIDPDYAPTPYMSAGPTGQVLSINAFLDHPSQPYSPKSADLGTGTSMTEANRSSTQFDPYHMVANRSQSNIRPTSSGSASSERPAFSSFPLAPLRRSKAQEAGMATGATDSTFDSTMTGSEAGSVRPLMDRSQSAAVAGSSHDLPSGAQPPRPVSDGIAAGGGEIIYQHRDGGVVRELPPPYLDRSRLDGGES